MITAQIKGTDKTIKKLDSFRDYFQREVTNTMSKLLVSLHRHVVVDKLNGQVLNRITGRLSTSINWKISSELSGERITGTVGTGVEYAAIHEYGFSGAVNVREHLRRTVTHQSWNATMTKIKKGKETGMALVHAHKRNVNMPQRSFLRSALADMAPQINDELRAAIHRAVLKWGGA